jgi:hypothetical protein
MKRVEQHLDIAPASDPEPKPQAEFVKVPEQVQIVTWIVQLALPNLCQEERLEIAACLKQAFVLNYVGEHAPPVVD